LGVQNHALALEVQRLAPVARRSRHLQQECLTYGRLLQTAQAEHREMEEELARRRRHALELTSELAMMDRHAAANHSSAMKFMQLELASKEHGMELRMEVMLRESDDEILGLRTCLGQVREDYAAYEVHAAATEDAVLRDTEERLLIQSERHREEQAESYMAHMEQLAQLSEASLLSSREVDEEAWREREEQGLLAHRQREIARLRLREEEEALARELEDRIGAEMRLRSELAQAEADLQVGGSLWYGLVGRTAATVHTTYLPWCTE